MSTTNFSEDNKRPSEWLNRVKEHDRKQSRSKNRDIPAEGIDPINDMKDETEEKFHKFAKTKRLTRKEVLRLDQIRKMIKIQTGVPLGMTNKV